MMCEYSNRVNIDCPRDKCFRPDKLAYSAEEDFRCLRYNKNNDPLLYYQSNIGVCSVGCLYEARMAYREGKVASSELQPRVIASRCYPRYRLIHQAVITGKDINNRLSRTES